MKILFVRSLCPNPITYGLEMRSSRFVDYLLSKGEVDLLTLTRPTDQADEGYIKNKFRKFFYFDQKEYQVRINAFEKTTRFIPWQLTEYYSKNIQEQINKILEDNQYDLIFIYKLNPVLYFLELPKKWHKRIVIDFDDILSSLYFKHYKNIFVSFKNSFSLQLYEQKAMKQFKRVFVCSEDAVSKIDQKLKKKVSIIPNVFPSNKENFFNSSNQKNNLLFVGSLDYFPNIEGLKWFFDHIWPEVKKVYPNLELTIIGKTRQDKNSLSILFNNPKDVDIVINVPSVLPYYKNCFISIVPLLNGSGTRLKILEAAAYGRPVLTTLKGMEGLNFKHKKELFIFNTAQSFIFFYKALLDNETYNKTTLNAYNLLEDSYSEKTFQLAMDKNWDSIQN